MKRDTLFCQRNADRPFSFDEEVASVYGDMVRRSIPPYQAILDSLPDVVSPFWGKGSLAYDLGASWGSVAHSLLPHTPKEVKWIAIEQSDAMFTKLKKHFSGEEDRVQPVLDSVLTYPYPKEKASLMVANFVLQFIDPSKRESFLKNCFEAMAHGAGLVISEKIYFEDAEQEKSIIAIHERFKRRHDYSQKEIERKKNSLTGVMRLDSWEIHQSRLRSLGFVDVYLWLQHYNFISIVARKP